ncbi:hypothetical protein MPSEU_000611700 [Mayamaea pseudoterrestris]|nr:hypothetical protein MPSEU_000611700 [Mayamaea pseudoterrestris]
MEMNTLQNYELTPDEDGVACARPSQHATSLSQTKRTYHSEASDCFANSPTERTFQPAEEHDGISLATSTRLLEPATATKLQNVQHLAAATPAAQPQVIINPYAKKQRTSNATLVESPPRTAERLAIKHEPGSLRRDSTSFQLDHSSACSPIRGDVHQSPRVASPSVVALISDYARQGYYAFYAAMFRTPPQDYVNSKDNVNASLALWEQLCERTDLAIVKAAIPPRQETVKEHFEVRASLVLEEAREVLAQALTPLWNQKKPKYFESFEDLIVMDENVFDEPTSSLKSFITYTLKRRSTHVDPKKDRFTDAELECLQGGGVCLMQTCGSDVISFAVIQPCHKDRLMKKKHFDVLALNLPNAQDDVWKSPHGRCDGEGMKLIPIEATFVSLSRQFHAVTTCRAREVPFINTLLGKTPTITDPSVDEGTTDDFVLARLNKSQARVAHTFLTSTPGSITIAQGPPGTGKSTLLVSILLRYVRNRHEGHKRIMVCAPTNKAVSIVATRFVSELSEDENINLNIIVTGNKDKLRDSGMPDVLKPYFLGSWQKNMAMAWEQVSNYLAEGLRTGTVNEAKLNTLCDEGDRLHTRMKSSLPDIPQSLMDKLDEAIDKLHKLKCTASRAYEPIVKELHKFIKQFRELDPLVVKNELMRTAAAVFCTLCSSGSPSILFTTDFDDLVVDEAAAATEPDLYIPFQRHPKRLLIVGDPKQLPSVVVSDRAKRLGLDVSLHERLMHGCQFGYILMNCQYRMHPQIASFPASRFYGSSIENGPNVCSHAYGGNANRIDCPSYTFYQVRGMASVSDACISHHGEAEVIVQLVQQLGNRAVGDNEWQSVDRIRVITFYKAQVALIRRKLRARGFDKIFVSTVDSSQGCEADVVLVSFVRGLDTAGFLIDNRRVNVALTRAKHQLVCVGNVEAMALLRGAKTETLRLLSKDATSRGAVALWERPINLVRELADDDVITPDTTLSLFRG